MDNTTKFQKILSDFNAKPIDYAHPTSMSSFDFTQLHETKISNKMEEELKKFFYNHGVRLDALIWQYEKFRREIRKKREEKLYEYLRVVREKICKDWEIYQDWDLCLLLDGKKGKGRIGIECRFIGGTYENPLGDFCIYITVWEKEVFPDYEEKLKADFPEGVKDDESWGVNRIVLRVARFSMDKTDENTIISTLKDTYNKLNNIIKNHKE